VKKVLKKILGDPQAKLLKNFKKRVSAISDLEPKYKELSDSELKKQTIVFKERLSEGEKLDDILPDAFAAAREASRRVLGQRHLMSN
jgi:preprotein translocase subunit SecA